LPQEDKKNMTKALITWEEIAIFLRVSVNTAKSYEKMGMPVKRPGGKIVRAFPDELESWQRKQP
jgi:phage terminase Nu1 subunit (DNA packaging protein)